MIEKNLLDRLRDSKVLHQISGKKYHIRAIRDIGVMICLDKNRNIDIGHKGHNFLKPLLLFFIQVKDVKDSNPHEATGCCAPP